MLRVVVVDDDETVSKKFERMIDWNRLNMAYIGCAFSREMGFRLVHEAEPDILITDIMLPGIKREDEFIREIRERYKELAIIVMTENKYFDFAYHIMQYDITRLLTKPLGMDAVESALLTAKSKIEGNEKRFSMHSIIDAKDIKNNNFMSKVISYLEMNYAQKIGLNDLANKFFLSSCHLCKQFKKYTERKFVDILNTIRIRHAQELLKDTIYKVYEIAEMVGYHDFTYFSAVFKKMVGMPPTQYRNKGGAHQELLVKNF